MNSYLINLFSTFLSSLSDILRFVFVVLIFFYNFQSICLGVTPKPTQKVISKENVSDYSGVQCNDEEKILEDISELREMAVCQSDPTSILCKSLLFPEINDDSLIVHIEPNKSDCLSTRSYAPLSVAALRTAIDLSNLSSPKLKTLEDFAHDTFNHIKRVEYYEKEIFTRFPEEIGPNFKGKNYKILPGFRHDAEKFFVIEPNRLNVPPGETWIRYLHRNYGLKIDPSVIDLLNKAGESNFQELSKIGALSAQEKQEVKLLIELVDQNDARIMRHGGEFPYKARPLPEEIRAKFPKSIQFLENEYRSGRPMTKSITSAQRLDYFVKIRTKEIGAYLKGTGSRAVANRAVAELAGGVVRTLWRGTEPLLWVLMPTEEIGCSETESILSTWEKNRHGNCIRNLDITPKVLKFIFDEDEKIKKELANPTNCHVFQSIIKKHRKNFDEVQCKNNSLKLKTGVSTIDVNFKNGKVDEVNYYNSKNGADKNKININYNIKDPNLCISGQSPRESRCIIPQDFASLPQYQKRNINAFNKNLMYSVLKEAQKCLKNKK